MRVEDKIKQLWEDNDGDFCAVEDGFVEVAVGEWRHEFKTYYTNYVVVKDVFSGKHYRINLRRSGDYYDGYDYSVNSVHLCKPVEKTIIEWQAE